MKTFLNSEKAIGAENILEEIAYRCLVALLRFAKCCGSCWSFIVVVRQFTVVSTLSTRTAGLHRIWIKVSEIGNLATGSAANAKKFFTNHVRPAPGISIKNLFQLRGFTSERNQPAPPY